MTYSIFHSTRALQSFLEAIAVLALIAAWLWPRLGETYFRAAERRFSRFAASRPRAIIAAGLFPMLARLVLLPVFPIPQPRVHDEFSYLLLGDTLAHGRLANPPPPEWRHFETEYELVQPTYASQYQPAQGIVLALGQIVTGTPWWGVWLSVGFMCAALCWALGGILTPSWALCGSLLAALQFGIFGFWMNGYFGGAVPATGGALIFGSVVRRITISSAGIAALGIVIVLASRPAEGLIWMSIALCLMAWQKVSKHSFLVFFILLAAGIGALAYYNARITGSAWEPPYARYRQQYGTPQSYWWQPAVIVTHFDHPQLAANYQDQLRYWQRRYSATAIWDSLWRRARDFWRFFIGPFLTPALLFLWGVLRRRRLRPWLWASGVFILEHATYHAWYPQQSASETVLIVLLVVEGWRRMRTWRPALSRSLALGFSIAVILLGIGLARRPFRFEHIWDTMKVEPNARETAIRRLENTPGKHLVFVHYTANHPWYDEWVFNGADIPNSRIVFARACSAESDRALAAAMSDRTVWIANPDKPPLLVPAIQ